MPTLKKFTIIDPPQRVNLSLKQSVREVIEQYRAFYLKAYGEACERSELVEQLISAFCADDKEFQAFLKAMPAAERATILKTVTGERDGA